MKHDINQIHKWSKNNKTLLDSDDWELTSIRGLGGGLGVGGGYQLFAVRSPSLGVYARLLFMGGGVAAGAFGGIQMPPSEEPFSCTKVQWMSLRKFIAEPFSLSNWCNAMGRLTVFGIAIPDGPIGWGWGKMVITAIYDGPKRQGYLFDKAELTGWGVGTGGLGAGVTWGNWILLDIPEPHAIDNNWKQPTCDQ